MQAALTALRERHFPPERNYLAAHVTLFHALPPERRAIWQADIEAVAGGTAGFSVEIGAPYSLGRGVALAVESPELRRLRSGLAARWEAFLSPQDRGPGRLHCTVQNKVAPAVARDTLVELQARWSARHAPARGLELWRYLNGPWALEARYAFGEPGRRICR